MRHHRKIVIGAPIIFMLMIGAPGLTKGGNMLLLEAQGGEAFVQVSEGASVLLSVRSNTPVNAVGGLVHFPNDIIEVTGIARDTSIVDLWPEEPKFSNSEGIVQFAAGMINREGDEYGKNGVILAINVKALKPGRAVFTISDGQLLANDGKATDVLNGTGALRLYVREQGRPSPDVNDDGLLNYNDVNTLYLRTYRPYAARYDLNNDSKVNWADVKLLLALI